jgi:hypothetical protein
MIPSTDKTLQSSTIDNCEITVFGVIRAVGKTLVQEIPY